MPFIGNGKGSDKIAYGPEVVKALEQLRAGTATHWFTYNFEVSRQRGELVREGPRLHDGVHPFRRTHQVRREKNHVHYDSEAREKLAALAEERLEARIKRLQNKVNNVGRPLDRYDGRRNALQGWDHPVEEPPDIGMSSDEPPEVEPHAPGPLEDLSVPLRYLMAEYLGPDDLLVVSMLGTAWFELGTSELLWYLQAVRLGCLMEGDTLSMKNQRVGLRDPGYCDGRAWAPGCLFAASWADLVRSLPSHIAVFAFVDFMGCPGIDPKLPARRHPLATAARLLEPGLAEIAAAEKRAQESGDPPPSTRKRNAGGGGGGGGGGAGLAERPMLLLFWDPVGTINTYRVPQLLHLCALQAARDSAFGDVTHAIHARRKDELRLERVIAWLGLGAFSGLPADKDEHHLLKASEAWDTPLTRTPEFMEGLADLLEREKHRNEKRAARKKKDDAAAAEKEAAEKGKVIRKIEGGDDDDAAAAGGRSGSRRRNRRGKR